MKLKLKPSMRDSKRYLLVKGRKEDIEKSIMDYIGILGWAKASPVFLEKDNNLILCINRGELNNVRAGFELSESNIEVRKVSGTIKGLE